MYWERVLWEDGGVAEEEVEGISEEGVCLKLDIMVSKVKKQTNSVIDNSKNFQVITHRLYWV